MNWCLGAETVEVGAELGMTKFQAAGAFRRLIIRNGLR